MVDALARTGDEGRGKLRKASGSCKRALIRGCPNGETQQRSYSVTPAGEPTQGTETSQYLEEEKSTRDSASSGERTRKSPNRWGSNPAGVVGPSGRHIERVAERAWNGGP